MLPRERRLRVGKEILHALRRGNRRSHGPIACSFVSRPGMLNRSAVIVGTKVSKLATERNLMKRRVRAVLLPLPLPGGDLVIQLRKGAESLDFPTLREHLLACVNRLG